MPNVNSRKKQGLMLAAAADGTIAARTLMLLIASATVTASSSIYARPQEQAAGPRPQFEVASVKLNKRGAYIAERLEALPGGRLVAENVPLRLLIMTAYDITPSQIVGAPSFGPEADRYDIEAKAPEGGSSANTAATGPDLSFGSSGSVRSMRAMLQTLLETRLRLKYRWIDEQRPVYALTIEKGGPKIKPTPEGSCVPYNPGDPAQAPPGTGEKGPVVCGFRNARFEGPIRVFEMVGVPLSEFAKVLTTEQLPVIDRTGLTGAFDINFRWAYVVRKGGVEQPPDPDKPAPGPSIFDAVKQQLGLKLEPTKAPVRVMLVEHFEKPSEN